MMIRFQRLSASNWRFNILVSLVTVGFTGCASNESINLVGEYAKQSTQLQSALIEVYESADDAKISAELVKAARDGVTGKGLDISTIDRSGQEALLRNLQTFTQSIYLLATDDRGEELDMYSQKLNSSLVSLSEMPQLEGIDDRDVELLTTSVNAIARAYTENKRYDLLKKVVIDSEEIVQNSLSSLEGELGAWKAATRVSLEKELRIRLYLLNNPNRCEGSDDRRCVTFEHSLEERVDAYEKAYEIRSRLKGLDARYAKLEDALRAIQYLNQTIVISLKSDDDATIDSAKKHSSRLKARLMPSKNIAKA